MELRQFRLCESFHATLRTHLRSLLRRMLFASSCIHDRCYARLTSFGTSWCKVVLIQDWAHTCSLIRLIRHILSSSMFTYMGHPVVRCWDCVRLLLFWIREKSHDATQRRRWCTNETLGSSRNDSLRIVAALERRKRGLQCPSQGSYVEELRLSCGKSWECFFLSIK